MPAPFQKLLIQNAFRKPHKRAFTKRAQDRANPRGGFSGSQTDADRPTRSGPAQRTLKSRLLGTVTASHKILTLQALSELSQCWRCKERLLEPRKGAFESPPAVFPLERPRPFARLERPKNFSTRVLERFSGPFTAMPLPNPVSSAWTN